MALFDYQKQVQRLVRDVAQKDLNPLDLTVYINTARTWAAGDSDAIKAIGTYTLTTGSQGPYPFSGIVLPGSSATTGVQSVLKVRQQWYLVGDGQLWFRGRSWPWFTTYFMNSAVITNGPPKAWAQYGEGANGTLYVAVTPDQDYTIQADCVCLPVPLVTDATVEALPAPWTVAIPYFAAYLALLSAQTSAGAQGAQQMLQLYEQFASGARRQATPDVMPTNFPGQPNPVRTNQLGAQGGGPGG